MSLAVQRAAQSCHRTTEIATGHDLSQPPSQFVDENLRRLEGAILSFPDRIGVRRERDEELSEVSRKNQRFARTDQYLD